MKNKIKHIIVKIIKPTPLYSFLKGKKKVNEEIALLNNLKANSKENINIYDDPEIHVINLNANDVCNSRCVMCNIWQQKKEHEITPAELETILKDPLYKNVKHIGVTGGEPTLREDLPQLFEAIIKAIPTIEGLSTITNCINQEDVIARIEEVIKVCNKYNKPFSMMTSIDGVGEVHERVRRRRGNFDSAINVLNHFTNKGIHVATGTTISKINVWEVDEMLDFMRENNIYGRFRIAEFIKRLYNDNNKSVIRNFDNDESYHLILFFYKLIYTFETNESYKRTYKSIINILAGGNRLIGCPYWSSGVVLNSRGEIAYCAPKSKTLGNTLQESSLSIYKNNLDEKRRILDDDCNKCIHDYHAPITYQEKLIELEDSKWRAKLRINQAFDMKDFKNIAPQKDANFQVFITGWYGTETVGDKAILAQIIDEIYEKYGTTISIVVSSIFPIITKRTLVELGRENIKTIAVYSQDFVAYAKGSDMVVMGGGPLMGLEELALPLISFKIAKSLKNKTVVWGCGIGPFTKEIHENTVKEILNLADEIKLRDQKSINIATEWLDKDIEIELSGDPARKYIDKKYTAVEPARTDKRILTCYLREWTHQYSNNLSQEDFLKTKHDFELGVVAFVKQKAIEMQADEILFDHMHNFVIGIDDRDYSRHLIKNYFKDFQIPVTYNKKLSTIDSVCENMKQSAFNICMRFHSVVFAHTLKTNFMALDYTNGGKIKSFLNDNNCMDKLNSIDDLIRLGKS